MCVDLGQLHQAPELLLLEPQHSDIEMSHSSNSLALQDPHCSRRINVEAHIEFKTKVVA